MIKELIQQKEQSYMCVELTIVLNVRQSLIVLKKEISKFIIIVGYVNTLSNWQNN